MSRHGLQRGRKYLKLSDNKNTFISPMTSTGKLNEVEQKITGGKNDWKCIESFIVGDCANIEG